MARDVMTLAFVHGKGWVPPEGDNEAFLAELAAIEAKLATASDDEERARLKTERRKAHERCAQECMVEIGKGSILSVDEGTRNAEVNINADHLNDPIHGHLDMTNFTLWANVDVIKANMGRCKYRIVVRRWAEVDPSMPWSRVPQGKRIRDLVVLEPLNAPAAAGNGQAPVPTPVAAEAGAVAVAAPPAPPVPAPRLPGSEFFPQPPTGPKICPLCGISTLGCVVKRHPATGRHIHNECPTPAASPAPVADQAPTETAPPAPPRSSGPKIAENKPWEDHNTDGSLNLGSFAVQAGIGMVEVAVELLIERRKVTGEAGPPPIRQAKALAARLLAAADQAQQMVRPDHRVDRSDGSHQRARGAVRVALRAMPVPWEGQPEQLEAERSLWVSALAEYSASIFQAGVELYR